MRSACAAAQPARPTQERPRCLLAAAHALRPAAPLRGGGERDVLPDQRDGEAEFLGAERRVEGADEPASLTVRPWL
jgi:hypothetical protein